MNIAVIGAGIAGLVAAWQLSRRHAVTLVEPRSGSWTHPLACRFVPLAALLLLVGNSPLRRRALPTARLASPSGAPNYRI